MVSKGESDPLVALGKREPDELDEQEPEEIIEFKMDPHEDEHTYVEQFYLGQKNDDLLLGELQRPPGNFNFHSCHNRRRAITRLRTDTMLKRQRMDKAEEMSKPFGSMAAMGGKVAMQASQSLSQPI